VSRTSRTVSAICGTHDVVDATLGVQQNPEHLAWNPRENRLYVANRVSNTISVIRDSSHAVGQAPEEVCSLGDVATVLTGATVIRYSLDVGRESCGTELCNVCGRLVCGLRPGPNDVSRLAPGVYFIRQASGVERQASSVTKVVIAR
jgi:YVTN family beta-propeller protein